MINSGIVEEGDKIFMYGLCCESSLIGVSDITLSLGITCLHLDPDAETTARATVGWYRSMLDLESVRHPGFAICLRETPCFAFSESDSISPLGSWVAPLAGRRVRTRHRPPEANAPTKRCAR